MFKAPSRQECLPVAALPHDPPLMPGANTASKTSFLRLVCLLAAEKAAFFQIFARFARFARLALTHFRLRAYGAGSERRSIEDQFRVPGSGSSSGFRVRQCRCGAVEFRVSGSEFRVW